MRRLASTVQLAVVVALTVAGVLLAACGSDDATTGSPTTSPTTSAAFGPVRQVARDVPYSSVVLEGHHEPLLDVYAPDGAEGLPLVVLFHGNPLVVDKLGVGVVPYGEIAEAVAAGGAVVVSANWGPSTGGMPATAEDFVVDVALDQSRAACAVSFAVEHAADYGADPSRLVLFGHSAGASMISPLVLGEVAPSEGCLAEAAWEPAGAVLWEGDQVTAEVEPWDGYGAGVEDAVAVFTPWGFLESEFGGPVVFAVTDDSAVAEGTRRCGDASWVASRDPSGEMQAAFEAIGAFDDGCVDLRELSVATAAVMQDHGLDASVIAFTDPTSTHLRLAPADLDLLSATIQEIATS